MRTHPILHRFPTWIAMMLVLAQVLQAEPAATNRVSQSAAHQQTYVLSPSDMVLVKVYQEEDLETSMRIARDGTATFPLIGGIRIGGKTVDQATQLIEEMLDKDFLVNPQVTLTVMEYAKRRFTVLGQVQKPGAYELPNEDSIELLEAIAMAGGYTRLANSSRITVTRKVKGQKIQINLDGKSMAKAQSRHFEILADDTILVGERIF